MSNEAIYLIQLVISGLAIGSLYSLIGLGFVLIYKATSILNFSEGEAMTLGAYVCYVLIMSANLPSIIAIIVTILFLALVGVISEFLLMRPMLGESTLPIVMITIGLSISFQSAISIIFGHDNVSFPVFFSKEQIQIVPGLSISRTQIWIILITTLLFILFFLMFKYTKIGLAMRATANDQESSYLMGVNIKRIFSQTWGISFIVAGIAGIFLAHVTNISPSFSLIAIRVFPVIVLGGMESIVGSIIGGMIIGVTENIVGGYFDEFLGGGAKDLTAFIILLLVLIIKPHGLFGIKKIERV
ncbi:MAG: branched-chain amino acid ABC transporter permease [Thermodesulfobacteriota bacterium]|nr:branched-chain amino acid ABC transporter permease [Thermodesulfobacteriota bacterium]